MSTDTSGTQASKPASWRKASRLDGGNPVRHRWQTDDRAATGPRSPRRRFPVALGLLVAAILGMLAYFVWTVAFCPVRTPFIAVAVPTYGDPFPPNAWSREDLENIATLHCETIDFVDMSTAWRSPSVGMRALDHELEIIGPAARRSGSAVVYLSMHGVVDGKGRPCLAPPAASPVNARTWLPVADVVDRLERFAKQESAVVLLVLDTARIDVDWNLGVLGNQFNERLVELIDDDRPENVVVMTASGVDEVAAASPELGGSIFGVQFQRGLAGLADERPNGNRDGRVSIGELHAFVVRQVNLWSRRNRALSQQPLLIPEGHGDHVLAWGTDTSRGLVIDDDASNVGAPAVSEAEIDELWTAYERVPADVCERVDPVAYGHIRRRLRRVEIASRSGRDYAESARREYAELLTTLTRASADDTGGNAGATKSNVTGDHLTIEREWGLLGPPPEPLPQNVRVHTLALAERWGTMTPTAVERIRSALSGYESNNSNWDDVQRALRPLLEGRSFAESGFPKLVEFSPTAPRDRLESIVATRRTAALLAAPRDERTTNWLIPLMRTADDARRKGEDDFLAGRFVDTNWKAVNDAYARVTTRSQGAKLALSCLDRADARLPWLAARLSSPQRLQGLDDDAVEAVDISLLDLTDDLRKLRQLVDASESASNGEALQFLDLAARVDKTLKNMQADLSAEYARLEGLTSELATVESPSAAELARMTSTLSGIEQVLAVPLLPDSKPGTKASARRGELRRGAADLRRRVFEKSPNVSEEDLPAGRTLLDGYVRRTSTIWKLHPAEIVLAPLAPADEPPSEATGELETWTDGEIVRNFLDGVPDRVQATTTGAAANVGEARRLRQRGAVLVRVAAPFWFPQPDKDPVRRLRLFDLRELLLWNAERVVDDFWGPAGTGDGAFFKTAGRNYLDAITRFEEDSPVLQEEVEGLRKKLEQRVRAARDGLAITSADVVVLNPTVGADVKTVVASKATAADGGIPAGTAATMIDDGKGPITSTVQPLAIPATVAEKPLRTEVTRRLGLSDVSTTGTALTSDLRYRGHRFSSKFLFEPVSGPSTVFVPTSAPTSTVRLGGTRRKPISVVFVLDCSNSMREASAIESREAKPTTKLDVARIALGNMLDELAPLPDVRVGLVLFGHRAAWEPGKLGNLRKQTGYARIEQAPPGLKPYADVEVVLPPGRFDAAIEQTVDSLLGTVVPWGESPLYLAVQNAARTLQPTTGTDAERVVIVLTDGIDNQFAPPPAARVTLDSVTRELAGTGIRVDVIGFGIPERERAAAKSDFEKLGTYDVQPAKSTALLESIRAKLGPPGYTVDGRTVSLGDSTTITLPPNRPDESTVAFDEKSTRLELWGGEFVDLVLDPNNRIVSRPADGTGRRVPLKATSGRTNSDPPRSVIIHDPRKEDDDVRLAFTFVRDDGAFPKRPRLLRFEITPVDARGRRSTTRYVFVDPAFVAGTSHPRVEYLARSWPANATSAEIRGWAAFEDVPPDQSIAVTIGDDRELGRERSLTAQPGVDFRISTTKLDQYQLDVYERVTGPGGHGGDLSFDLQPATSVQRIVRQFDHGHGIVTHTFVLKPTIDSATKLELQVRGRTEFLRRAAGFPNPVLMEVKSPRDVVLPTRMRSEP